ncbi:MAG: hypothetical protein H7Z41_08630 [Cytophagales bacterium]|nr:hypothetical protein [Armatimonadota bacterium]
MKVVLNEPGFWYLLRKGDTYYIDVNCEASFVGFTLMIGLSEDEYREYHALGRTFLSYFAEKINYWSRNYKERNVTGPLQKEAMEAILRLPHETPRPPDGSLSLPE